MKYAIVFSSCTGNTTQLATALKNYLPQEDCVYFGTPNEQALSATLIFVGFWTDKGDCDKITKTFLKTLKDRQLFLFGTAGFGGNPAYYKETLTAVKANTDTTATIIGDFMCQGKMPTAVLKQYEKALLDGCERTQIQGKIDNFHSAAAHPNQADLDNLKYTIDKTLKEYSYEKEN